MPLDFFKTHDKKTLPAKIKQTYHSSFLDKKITMISGCYAGGQGGFSLLLKIHFTYIILCSSGL